MLTPAQISKRGKIVAEILSTELAYVSDLAVLCESFVVPLRTYLSELTMTATSPSTEDNSHATLVAKVQNEHNTIFSNIEQLLAFNRVFQKDLATSFEKDNGNNGNNIGKIFMDAAPFFKMYSTYVSNYERSEATLRFWLQTHAASAFIGLHSFIRAVELQQQCHGLKLLSFLIMPVQRVPRYKMLIAELLKVTDESHPDHQHLVKSLSLISSVATALNNDMKNTEIRKKTMDAAMMFESLELLTPSRLFVKQGVLKKVCRSAKKDFTFVLFNDCLIYGSPKLTSGPTGEKYHKLHREISLHNSYVVDPIVNFMEGFLLINSQKSFYIDCGSALVKNEWVAAIKEQHTELNSKLQMESSWRNKYSKWENEIEVWGMDEAGEAGDQVREVWGLNGEAMNQGRGMLEVIPCEDIRKLGEPGIALISHSEDLDRHRRTSRAGSMVGDAMRRMSHKFSRVKGKGGEMDRESMEGSVGRASLSPIPVNMHENQRSAEPEFEVAALTVAGLPSPGQRKVEFSGQSTIVAVPATDVPDTPFNQVLYEGTGGRPKAMTVADGWKPQPPPKPERRMSAPQQQPAAARLANSYLVDSSVKFTDEVGITCSVYGLGLELVDAASPYSDHPSSSIVRVAGFSNLPNGHKSPGQVAGLQPGDYIVAFEGVGVSKVYEVSQLLKGLGVRKGVSVRCRIRRANMAKVKSLDDSVDLLGLDSSNVQSASSVVQEGRKEANPEGRAGGDKRFSLNHGMLSLRAGEGAWEAEAVLGGGDVKNAASANDVDVMDLGEMDFLNLFGVTKHQYRAMSEGDRTKRRSSVGL